jgi:hypothetical protein
MRLPILNYADTPTSKSIGRHVLLLIPPVLLACSPLSLDQGDTLLLSFEPGLVFVPLTSTAIPSTEATSTSCQDAGGAVVHLGGFAADGTAAQDTEALVWLSSPSEGRLIPIASTGGADDGTLHVTLDNGKAMACFRPGTTAGSVIIKARSGVVETSQTIEVHERKVPVDGAIGLTVTPPDSYLSAAATAAACGASPMSACGPGRARRAAIGLTAPGPQSGGAVPEGASVVLTTDKGWLTLTDDCGTKIGPSQIVVNMKASAGTASLCLDDSGGTAVLSALSGTATATKSITVPALPAALVLTPSASSVKASGSLTLTAFVSGCDGKGIGDMPVSLTVEGGTLTFEMQPSAILSTAVNGTVSVTGVAVEGPLTVKTSLSTDSSIECTRTIEVKP